ncbi:MULTISPECIES: hypothetical protein [Streptomyces]|nr:MULTISPECIES: hypothetical protein [Streptomyces]WCL88239.1 hypothetical protein PPN52_28580 [Streptomyces sp. JCM 35825]
MTRPANVSPREAAPERQDAPKELPQQMEERGKAPHSPAGEPGPF